MKILKIHRTHIKEFRTVTRFLLLMFGLMLCAIVLPKPDMVIGLAGYVPLHTLFEVLAISIAFMVFSVGWSTQKFGGRQNILWLSGLFLGVGILDISHMLSYAGMPAFVTSSSPEKAINFWLAARLFAAIG